ncbi:hypothetical protein A9Q81_20195 [Gammaproteobacteria bacterium 42_54_T18]|nr:hypothetical protein A9Q81_20195 [Gammaproteobacteria bacterium 42_54_T18]
MEPKHKLDALADILNTIRLSANTYFCSEFTSPWGMKIDKGSDGIFHVVVEGSCWLNINNSSRDPIHLNTGDIVAFPTGGAHSISDTLESKMLPGSQVVENILSGNNPFQESLTKESLTKEPLSTQPTNPGALHHNILMCGSFHYDSSINHPFLKDLPCFIHIKAEDTPELHWLRSLVSVLASEARLPAPGSTVMVDRLTEVLFIQLMRAHMETSPDRLNYMAALADPQIGPALNHIHAESEFHWTVERLGEAVSLSRTSFTEKFSRLVGMPPKTYLLNWRMQKAKTQLETTNTPMIDIAESAGYSSEAAFSKAFKQFFDTTPGRARRKNK